MTDLLKITGGRLYDPANSIDGEVRDLWIRDGKMVAAPADATATRIIDAAGMVIMPGGIDMHCHIAGSKANAARKLRPEEKRESATVPRTAVCRSGLMGSVPTTFATGYRYAGLGYTTAMDAAVAPLFARHTHDELSDTPCIDKGFYVLLGNNQFALRAIAEDDRERLRAFVAWQLNAAKSYAVKLVNPGGIEVWKRHSAANSTGIDEPLPPFEITPRQVIRELARAVDDLGLPHPIHLHCNQLGMPGNWTTTLESMRALEGQRAHLTHIQFHSYAGADGDEDTLGSAVASLADYVNEHTNISVDVGQVLFGDTTCMTADGAAAHFLSNLYGTKWYNQDIEMESGCGIAPISYRQQSLVHAWQWAIGLEWYLLVNDPWRVAMSTDHPNGGSFLAYPQIIRLLMDRSFRREALARIHPRVAAQSALAHLEREYSLNEIAIITRAGPARMLGLAEKGHLGIGADADITIYTPDDNREVMFALPRYVIKSGEVLVEQGEIRREHFGKTIHVAPEFDEGIEPRIAEWFEDHYTVRFRNYPVDGASLPESRVVACNGK